MDTGIDTRALLGRTAVDERGRRLGRVVAVVHGRERADVLVEGRGIIRRRSRRFPLENVSLDERGRVRIVGPAPVLAVVDGGDDVQPRVGTESA